MSGKKIVLISFLGTGRYEKVGYKWDQKEIGLRTEFVSLALCKFLQQEGHDIENVVILSTEQAKLVHGAVLRQALQENNLPYDFVDYPVGNSKEEIQEQFNILVKYLNCGDFEVALDITHGFRSMPFFAAAATVFVSMVHQKKPKYIFYGAFQSNGKDSEIWELNNFTNLIDWSHALTLFLQTGNVGKVVEKTGPLSRQISVDWIDQKQGERPLLHRLSKSLQRFGESLATVRTGDLLLGPAEDRPSAAEELLTMVQSLKPQVESLRHFPRRSWKQFIRYKPDG